VSAKVGGLANGTAYTFRLTATSANGTSGLSSVSNAVTPAGAQVSPSAQPSVQPSSQPSLPPATDTPGEPKQAARDVGALTAWLQANAIVIPIALVVLIAGGFAAQFLTSRSRRKR
jgi:hypothetical protein